MDNLLRPMLVGKATLMPDCVVMITTLGGMVVFGIHGFVLGPVIAAMFFAAWHLHLETRQAAAMGSSVRPDASFSAARKSRARTG